MIIYEQDKKNLKSKLRTRRRSVPKWGGRIPAKFAVIVTISLSVAGALLLIFAALPYFTSSDMSERDLVASNVELTDFRDVYLTFADEQTRNAATASLLAPKSWQRQRTQFGASDLIDQGDYGILQIVFSKSKADENDEKQGRLIIENITSWLAADQISPESGFGGISSRADKQKLFEYLTNLRQSKSVDQTSWAKLFKDKSEIGGIQKPTYVNTADGKLGGIIYATIVSTDNSYRPHVVAYLVGSIAGQSIILRARFSIENQTYRELYGSIAPSAETVQQAVMNYKNGALDVEDTVMLGHVGGLLKSFTLDTASRIRP